MIPGLPSVQGLVSKRSPWPVAATVERLRDEATARGLTVFAVFDHSGEARAHDLELRDTQVVVFGSPVAGTPVMQAAPLAALDLPLRVLVLDDGGQTVMCFVAPAEMARRYGLPPDLANRLAGVEAITDVVAAGA
jgi:uncharacterized protein (DUF302 family)